MSIGGNCEIEQWRRGRSRWLAWLVGEIGWATSRKTVLVPGRSEGRQARIISSDLRKQEAVP